MTESNIQYCTNINNFEELDEIDKKIVTLKFENPSITQDEIAYKMSMSRQTIQKRLAKDEVKIALSDIQKDALQVLIEAQKDVAIRLRDIALSEKTSDTDAIRASKEILKGVLSEKINIAGELSIEDKFKNLTDEQIKQRIKELESRD